MKTLKQLREAKQVGTIYHYTTVASLHNMLHSDEPFKMESRNSETISASRNPQLPVHNKNFSSCHVRIALDGDKISEHHKVKPVAGLADNSKNVFDLSHINRVKRESGEHEEAILHHPFNMKNYIKHIHIVSSKDYEHVKNVLQPKMNDMKITNSHGRSFLRESSFDEDKEIRDWDGEFEIS